jgi:MFS family permease
VLCARISDVIGRRAAFAASYVVFIAFSLACGWARGMGQLIAFRAVQGLGGSGEFFYFVGLFCGGGVSAERSRAV